MNRNGAVLWRGISVLGGAEIVVIATGLASSSENDKTGDLIQTWILRVDRHPGEAMREGSDFAICGNCPHRKQPDGSRSCYVQMRAPASVWKCFTRGNYPDASESADSIAAVGAGRKVRLGSYGDPAAVPCWVWNSFTRDSLSHTGYTHQIDHPEFDFALLRLCMVSADSVSDAYHAAELDARSFLVRPKGAPLPEGFAQCPAAIEAGKRVQCADCMLCGGASVRARSISIEAHGNGAKYVSA